MSRLCLSVGRDKVFIRENEVIACERRGRYTRLYHRYGQTDVKENLEDILREAGRLQYSHQSFLVDPARIFRIRAGECQVRLPEGGLMIIPVSKKYRETLLKALGGGKL